MANYTMIQKFLPPETHQILAKHLPEGYHWYEMRSGGKTASFQTEKWDLALSNGRRLKRIFSSSELYYCWKSETGTLEEIKIL